MRKALCLLALLICGCSSSSKMKYLGQLGNDKVYVIHAGYADGPNITALATVKPSGESTIHQQFSGPGVSTSLYPAAAQVISSGIVKPSDFKVSVTQPK